MIYKRCGNSGLLLPVISLGLWHNFGDSTDFQSSREMLQYAFDSGITHFDLANNYGIPAGSAETTFGKILKTDFSNCRDEMLISTKAGYDMWKGPYGTHGSKKHLSASINQSLKRLNLEYVDIFYHHREDKNTPLEETLEALIQIVKSGKALYIGISNYSAEQTKMACEYLKNRNIKLLIHQLRYNMFDRDVENDLLDLISEKGMGCIAYSPLAQGILTDRYLLGIPKDSRVETDGRFLSKVQIEEKMEKVLQLKEIADNRKQSISQLAISWLLQNEIVTSVLIGASKKSQIQQNLEAIQNQFYTDSELQSIEAILHS